MKIAIVGSTGRTGRHLLEQGLKRGHTITAFTRRPQELQGVQGLETVVHGDGLKLEDVRRTVQGQDAVISIAGSEDVTRNIITAMQEAGVRRLICVSAYPIAATRPWLLLKIVKTIFRKPYAGLARMEQAIFISGLDWTIVRPPQLKDGPATGRVRAERNSPNLPSGPYNIRRADLAAALLDIAENPADTGQTIAVAEGRANQALVPQKG